ncbi:MULTISPECIES: ATPase, T2SS/T4P/T4SS family [unclassified Polaromonas]|jgi:type II secretory ATPase GspE/PulE/Tfp pilus assembly ATPase PilB-like protein|uniref:GspE/PulE family protein n=1 Tax=unclassified Polaromonas TaxID=2638319 RepID=UPI000BCE31A0|nr:MULTISPECIES: ATPase, T2SS/T4P/T4SS family [unclassified Polaromonas]OYY38516.1 MAG: secretion system protein E [Polaromonas sp. 35-63-35]OYZ21326.1 MAG: secretion system protein E [Polaromonas sp. 16-63-31]OYZ79082.1 MAG: secretion system protein E [Polaromonas sp. 24-63-21]OZA50254.1 MAG: secretion system protein E [Polaromonas sp. 17-63-33]OZA89250.1 MAG: secretion system protein E [Polaromonas sp. 39-63-25]
MNAVVQQDHEDAFFDSQMLPPQERGVTFEALYFRQLQLVTNRIHETENIDQIMLEASQDICKLFNADRLTLYAVNEDRTSIISKVKTGLNTSRDLKLPISAQSIAGYVALSKTMVNIADVYDDEALKKIHPNLSFLQEVDKRSGYRTKQMLVAPVMDGSTLYGVLQVINNRSDQPFAKLEEDGAQQLCQTLGIAIRQRMQKAEDAQRRRATKYDGLVTEGVLSQDELLHCIQKARDEVQSVEHLLMADYRIRPAQIGASLSKFFGVPYEAYNAGRIRSEMLHGLLKRHFVEQQGWMPLEETPDGLVIMCVDPEAVRGARVVPQVFPKISKFAYCVTTQTEFDETLSQLFGAGNEGGSIDQLLADMDSPLENDANDDSALESAAADNELVKFVNKVIIDAYKQKASDIHIEPMPGKAKTGIRFRIDGSLLPYIEVPAQFRQAMVTRLKIMCDLDISEKRKPQDGKIKFKKYGPLDIELRVATIPSAGGVEDVVMRILAAGEPIPLEKLGLTDHNRERLEKTVSKPYGLFYVCGPTGSGKTTTLHSILKFLNTPDTKIWTAEDPVEITQKGLRQVQINRKAGIDFALVMRAFLRADPDIIMVGESRDKETVSMGVEASLTGHLVFSTLHTNSAPESITRLLDMGMDPFNFADALLGILAQRLAKKLCDCKQAYQPSSQEVKDFIREYSEELRNTEAWKTDPGGEAQKLLDDWMERYGKDGLLTMYRAVGCDKCNQTGYKGRIGLHELMVADDPAKKLIQERARVAELFAAAVNSGMHTLKMDGMEKVLMGLTDLKQVRSVCIK